MGTLDHTLKDVPRARLIPTFTESCKNIQDSFDFDKKD